VAEIANASKEQSQGIGQVTTAVAEMDKVTQSTAANAEESASASEELNAQAMSLLESVGSLQQLVGTAGAARERRRPDAPAAAPKPKGKQSFTRPGVTRHPAPKRDQEQHAIAAASTNGANGHDDFFKNS
jgi:methyl-accepting chemotaxis protein